MSIQRLLIANRGEIALRIARTAHSLGMTCIGIYPEDDLSSLHVKRIANIECIAGVGPAAYLDIEQIILAAKRCQADAIHPGYGFLSENPVFAARCAEEGILFVGPDQASLSALADKSAARALAIKHSVPVLAGTNEATTIEQATSFFEELKDGSQLFIKALAGGGGRGMRLVDDISQIPEAFESAAAEAKAAFGDDRLYVERCMTAARHIEIQIVGDGDTVIHLHERDCSLQRRNQKVLEIAPAPHLPTHLKASLCEAALTLANAVDYKGLGTFEFLVSMTDETFAFMEANPRIQVEHTITEEILDLDLVALQLQIAGGKSLAALGVRQNDLVVKGYSVQARINAETLDADGSVKPSGGQISYYEVPQGRGIRMDGAAYSGWQVNPRYDSMISKLIVSNSRADYPQILRDLTLALQAYRIGGVQTSLSFMRALACNETVKKGRLTTRFIDQNIEAILKTVQADENEMVSAPDQSQSGTDATPVRAVSIQSHLMGTVVDIMVASGEEVAKGQVVAVLEAMKMEHQVISSHTGIVVGVPVAIGQTVLEQAAILHLEPREIEIDHSKQEQTVDPDFIRPDLKALLDRQAAVLDDARSEAVGKRHAKGKRTIRENIDQLIDPGSLSEYGSLNVAAQRSRHSVETLEKISPADGMVAGTASINGDHFDEEHSAAVVLGYDYMVFAGTQGVMNHKKTDRLLHLAEARKLPIVFYGEGGGGRPGDVDINAASTLDVPTFQTYARLSGLVPRIGVASGRCFAGNAALMGVSDILIATEDTSIGMGGPAMIEGGGLGVYTPEEVGPVSVQAPNGVIDVVVKDEQEATEVARKALSYFQGTIGDFEVADQRLLRASIPENRLRVYDIRSVIEILADKGSVLELRRDFAKGMITAFIRLEGRPVGLIANNPMHLGGAIDADGSEKAARHIQLCDAFDIPILTLCDTPGFMVGPDAEKTALVRKTARLFVAAGSATVPFFTVILRKGYGLGAQAMGGGSMHAPFACFSWPTGEMGPMGLEGAVRLGYKKELAAIEDMEEREHLFRTMVDEAYLRGKAVNAAAFMEIDDVIDPADTRQRLLLALQAAALPTRGKGRKRTFVDTW
ncbi:acetyl-CoA carboxylase family protein [Sneathiella aquimaris]|uniref:acetyl-CoA carboxylase family protein n=1 Tax=Sneathiella aquimaris TaxID=2599305 RepID=UPI001469EBC8|nr:carboxyl transferase domain-containing protein [Sneathiella aquimaris]